MKTEIEISFISKERGKVGVKIPISGDEETAEEVVRILGSLASTLKEE